VQPPLDTIKRYVKNSLAASLQPTEIYAGFHVDRTQVFTASICLTSGIDSGCLSGKLNE